jgi:hypothetical protein
MRGYPGAWACECARARVALLSQHATRLRHNVFSSAGFQAPPHFSTLSHKGQDFRKKVIEPKMCVLTFSTTLVSNTSDSKKNSERFCFKCKNVFM